MSKVLNGRGGVGEQTRQRVEALLRDHGYRRPLPTGTSQGLEVVFHQMLGSIAIEIMRGVEEAAGTRDCTVGFTDVRRHVAAGRALGRAAAAAAAHGASSRRCRATAEHCELLAASGVPLVAIDPVGDLFPTLAVGTNNWSGAVAAARYLLDLGHRRIGVLTGPVQDLCSRARLDGFRAALDHAGIPFDDTCSRRGVFTFEDGRASVGNC